jgi:hypothetical protein
LVDPITDLVVAVKSIIVGVCFDDSIFVVDLIADFNVDDRIGVDERW